MYRLLAIWLATSSIAQVTKSAKCMSTTGTRPVMAAPMAEPTMAASEMGALRTRPGPNSSARPLVTPNGTPSTMSSPMQYTRASRLISSRSARFRASPKSMTAIRAASPAAQDGGEKGPAARRRPKVAGEAYSLYVEPAAEGAPKCNYVWVADGPLPGARAAHRSVHGRVDGEHVVAVHGHAGNAVARRARRDAAARGRVVVRGGRRPEVVFADEDHRHLPQGREIDALVKGAPV